MKPGIHKYDYHLTLDPRNATPGVILSEGNRRVHCKQKPGDLQHPTVLLSKEALTERHYWEVEWRPGILELGVAYSLPVSDIARLGEDDQSWAICCDQQVIMAVHNDTFTMQMRMQVQEKLRVGVYLDWPSGTLAFYKISSKGVIHLHTFHAKFTQPLYAAFAPGMDVPMTLC
ncbi:hypothetical protein GJAV_G00065730 [Gymnothorax javanicus]|nr:hypothetical protein GJAV_G00065730 [Gymnothorax javanicus]